MEKLFNPNTDIQELVDIANDPNTSELSLVKYYFDVSIRHSFVANTIRSRLGTTKLIALKEELKIK